MKVKSGSVTRRLKEPSTWAGLGILGTVFSVKELAFFGAPEVAAVMAALAAILMPEPGSKKEVEQESIK